MGIRAVKKLLALIAFSVLLLVPPGVQNIFGLVEFSPISITFVKKDVNDCKEFKIKGDPGSSTMKTQLIKEVAVFPLTGTIQRPPTLSPAATLTEFTDADSFVYDPDGDGNPARPLMATLTVCPISDPVTFKILVKLTSGQQGSLIVTEKTVDAEQVESFQFIAKFIISKVISDEDCTSKIKFDKVNVEDDVRISCMPGGDGGGTIVSIIGTVKNPVQPAIAALAIDPHGDSFLLIAPICILNEDDSFVCPDDIELNLEFNLPTHQNPLGVNHVGDFKCYLQDNTANRIVDEPVTLNDQFIEDVDTVVREYKLFCNSADKDNFPSPFGSSEEMSHHLKCWDIDPIDIPDTMVDVITEQFGTFENVNVLQAVELCTPADKIWFQGNLPSLLDQHWLCYEIDPVAVDENVLLTDQFLTTNENLGDAIRLCNPVEKTRPGEDPTTIPLPEQHLFCIDIVSKDNFGTGGRETHDQFGRNDIFGTTEDRLCVEALKITSTGVPVGGKLIPLDSTMILLAGTHNTAAWMIPVLVSAIGIGIVIARKF